MRQHILTSLQKATALIFYFFALPVVAAEANTALKAETLFNEMLYGDALPLYNSLISNESRNEFKEQWALRLARCQIEEGEPQKAVTLLSSLPSPSHPIDVAFLKSIAFRRMKHHSQALSILDIIPLPKLEKPRNLIRLEQGYHLLEMGELNRAQTVLKSVQWLPDTSLHHELAQVLIAKIALTTKKYEEALQALSLATHPSLHPITTYLKGWTFIGLQRGSDALRCFDRLNRDEVRSSTPWREAVLKGLITSSLVHALKCNCFDELVILFSNTATFLNELQAKFPSPASNLLWIDFYLAKAKTLSDPTSYSKAKELIARIQPAISEQTFNDFLIKQAAAAPSYEGRKQLFAELSNHLSSSFSSTGWFLTGLNHFEEGLRQQNESLIPSLSPFEEAVKAFIQSTKLNPPPEQLSLSLKYLAIASLYLPSQSSQLLAWETAQRLATHHTLSADSRKKKEMFILLGFAALRLGTFDTMREAQSRLQLAKINDKQIDKLLGLLSLKLGEWGKADAIFSNLLTQASAPSMCGEILFWRGLCAGLQQKEELQKEYFKQAYVTDPQNPYAPIAYFYTYSSRDYMQGNRKAIKHLRSISHLFPNHPLLINAYYLIGLYHTKDLLSDEGTIIRYKDWTSAIDAFELAETTFDTLLRQNLIPPSDRYYYLTLRYQAQLERAKANFSIGQQTAGGKRAIYLEYSEEVFKKIINDFEDPGALAYQGFVNDQTVAYHKIWADAEFYLSRLYEEKKEWEKVEEILASSLSHYEEASVVHGYGLMRAHTSMGKLMRREGEPERALAHFQKAEQSAKEHLLTSPKEKLDLWIQQSLCYKELNELDQAMRLLSRAINDDVISPLRIKAMLLRAEIYEMEGRPELALKQLDAAARKGGEWAQQAKEKMEKTYGYTLSVPNNRL